MSRPDSNHVTDAVRAATKLLAGLDRRITAQLVRAARGGSTAPDGYPTGTLGGGGGGATIEVDGDRIPVTTVEAAALAETPADEQRRVALWAWHQLDAIVAMLRNVDANLARSERAVATTAPDDDAWCENHLRHGVTEPRDTANRRRTCRWCYDVQRSYGVLPNAALIDRRARGERMTEQGIASALGIPVRKAG